MDDLYALDGGAAATRWRNKRRKRLVTERRNRKRRAETDSRLRRWEQEQRRKARVKAIEQQDRKKKRRRAKARARILATRARIEAKERKEFLRRRKAEGYTNPGFPYKDLTGQRFGIVTVVKPGGHRPSGAKNWWIRCDCGGPLKEVSGTALKQGCIRSCGCYGRGNLREPWHSPKFYRHKAKRERAKAKEAKRPLSSKLLKVRRRFREGSYEAKVLSAARNAIVCLELLMGKRRPKKCWKTQRYTQLLRYLAA